MDAREGEIWVYGCWLQNTENYSTKSFKSSSPFVYSLTLFWVRIYFTYLHEKIILEMKNLLLKLPNSHPPPITALLIHSFSVHDLALILISLRIIHQNTGFIWQAYCYFQTGYGNMRTDSPHIQVFSLNAGICAPDETRILVILRTL